MTQARTPKAVSQKRGKKEDLATAGFTTEGIGGYDVDDPLDEEDLRTGRSDVRS